MGIKPQITGEDISSLLEKADLTNAEIKENVTTQQAIHGRREHIFDKNAILENIVKTTAIVETMNECLWVGDENHKTIYVNPVFEKTSGYSLKECLGKDCGFFFDEEGKKILDQNHKLRKIGKSSQYEANMVTKGNQLIPLLISGSPLPTGGTLGIFTNLTRLKKLANQEKINEQIFRYSSEAFVILNKNRKVKLWSNGARKMLGYKEEEVLNKSIDIVIPTQEEESNKKLVEDVKTRGYIKNVETKRLAKNGELIDVFVSVTKVMDDDKKNFIGYLVIYEDITSQKRANSELQKRFETIQDAYKELGLQRRQLDYLYEILDVAISSQTTTDNLAKLIISALCLLTKCDGGVLRLFEEKRKILRLKSCFGVNQKWLDKNQIKFENSIAEEAFKKERPIVMEDIDTYHKHQGLKLLRLNHFKTMILIPLFVKDKFLGSISLYASDSTKFRLIETDFLEKMGKQCSLALYVKKHSCK